MKYIFTILLITVAHISFGQTDTVKTKTAADTILTKLLKTIPKELQADFIEEYNSMPLDRRKQMLEFMEFMSSMPQSSKKELILNIDSNYTNVAALKDFFKKIVPAGYSIYIEFHPPEKHLGLDENIDFWVSTTGKISTPVFQEWNVELKSAKLDSLLRIAKLSRNDLRELKIYLDKAKCISIINKDVSEIGYARSGMGKYSYLLFDKPLTAEQKKQYNNGCTYIFYRDNIVLEYGGGAVGPQCFPDRE